MLKTHAAREARAKALATPPRFEVGDLIELHVLRRGLFRAAVIDCAFVDLARMTLVLFEAEDGVHSLWVFDQSPSLTLIERDHFEVRTEPEISAVTEGAGGFADGRV